MLYLKADTITEVTIGPAVAVGDGFTPVTNLVGSTADEFEIIKHGATTTTTIAGTLAAITGADGYYALDLSATDTNTEGRLVLLINDDSLILPLRHEFMVINANVYDSLFAAAGTDLLQTDLTQVAGATTNVAALATNVDAILTDTADIQPNYATSSALATAQTDLDTITGAAGAKIDVGTGAGQLAITSGAVDNVTLVATTTTNTDMRGTDSAALASVATEGRLAELDAANLPADIDNILTDTGTTIPGTITTLQADTDDIQTRLPAALVSGKMDSDMVAISGSTAAADNLEESTEAIITGASVTGTLSTTVSTTDITGYLDDELIGRTIIWKSGDANGQASDITDYAAASGTVTYTAITTAPVNGDLFVIV